jgi:putative selenate reductase
MSDKLFPIPLRQFLQMVWEELDTKDSYFGIPRGLFHKPLPPADNPLGMRVFGRYLANPLGVAAGPHSQMCQNIVGAWLAGARYIELKTVQTLDELEVARPCIDMQDEGYNCEWSQELKIRQSFQEYLHAWVAIHLLNHKLGWPAETGTLFNMSAGYNLEGIRNENVQWFLDKMADCSAELSDLKEELRDDFPEIDQVDIPVRLSDNITLSTMHGCPPEEIGAIASYLLKEKRLHTYVKLNPTLLGPGELRRILHDELGFRTQVPDQAFEHDLKYGEALRLIEALQKTADEQGLEFGLKLTNTLESVNNKVVFGRDVEQMYMSGRALHPLSVNLAAKLQQAFGGRLDLSFSGGADAFNIADLLRSGFLTVTVCSDLLKPGGYMRLHQYFEHLMQEGFPATATPGGTEYPDPGAPPGGTLPGGRDRMQCLDFLMGYAQRVRQDKAYRKASLADPDIKTPRKLGAFDCISAPCRDTCATGQDIPDYMHHAANRQFDKGLEVILRTNPFPRVTGMVCDHLCQNKCTRVHYDQPLLIREVKRFLAENGQVSLQPAAPNGLKVSVIGAGPAGMSCAFFLALAGFSVDVYEAKSRAGGMVQYAIPGFRLTDGAIEEDLRRIAGLGVIMHFNARVDRALFHKLKEESHYVFVGAGAQMATPLRLDGMEAEGVLDPLSFLMRVKEGKPAGLGRRVLVIGGGNTAMDAARTAYRLVGEDGRVSVVYRRTLREMPADQGEIRAVLEEGVDIMELTAPERVVVKGGRVTGLACCRMTLSGADASGRPRPQKIPDSGFVISCDTIIPAVGQSLDIDFVDPELLETGQEGYGTRMDNVFTGGDAMRGASTAINAIGDGRKAARQIMKQAMRDHRAGPQTVRSRRTTADLMGLRARRQFAVPVRELPLKDRRSFSPVQETLEPEEVVREAGRCLFCDELCSICTTVCPNFANLAYQTSPWHASLQKVVRGPDGQTPLFPFDQDFELTQRVQILNIANFCNECGNCRTFCPTDSAPYREKPKLHLGLDSFNGSDKGYYLSRIEGSNNLIYKEKNRVTTLSETHDAFTYHCPEAIVRLDRQSFHVLEASFVSSDADEVSLLPAARMRVILDGAKQWIACQRF